MKNKPRFRRKESLKKSRLGKRRKNKLKWRRQKGKHSKIRAKRKGYPRPPSIGYGSNKKKIKEDMSKLITVYNLDELEKIKKGRVILGHTSKKNKIKLAIKAMERGIEIVNLNKKFMKNLEKEKIQKLEMKK